ncbi:MAG: MBL fold metallo-hydrolase [Promethearchaeota archaeon]
MTSEEFKFLNKSIPVKEQKVATSNLKIRSYKQKLRVMEEQEIPQKPIDEVLNHLFKENKNISRTTLESINKIIFISSARIIILILTEGREILKNRNKMINLYGWFFFVSESEEALQKKPKDKTSRPPKKKEQTVSTTEYMYKENSIVLKHKKNMRPLYKTKERAKYRKLIQDKKVPQMPIKDVLDDFFLKYEKVPLKEKKVIQKIIYYQEEKVIVVKSLIGDKIYENLKDLVLKYGWYFYITGVPVGESEISLVVDSIEKRYNESVFSETILLNNSHDDEIIPITLYPIVLKPNHNCTVLGIGPLKILLDCGIIEEHFDYLKEFLDNYEEFLENKVKSRKIFTKEELEEKMLKEIDTLREFEDTHNEKSKDDNNLEEDQGELKESDNNEEFPRSTEINPEDYQTKYKIDAIFISHSHYDHISGLKDLVKIFPDVPIFCSRITLDLFLIRDSNFLKQESLKNLEEEDYINVVKNVIFVENGSKIEFKEKNCYLSFFHAGHMPGALMLLAKVKDFRFLYTGDYTYWDISPFAGTRRFLNQISRPIDFLLIDGSSAHEDFGDPNEHMHSIILFLEAKAESEDNVLIGADPSSLAISFMLSFWRFFRKLQLKKDFKNRPNIYVDMMVRKNIQVINHRYEFIYGPISRLIRDKANPFNSIKFRWFDHNDLDFLREKNNIIISHPPDLSYGIIRPIISSIGRRKHNLVFLSGSIHEQPGVDLINGAMEIEFTENWKVPFRAMLINTLFPDLKVKLHGDKSQLLEMIKALEPKEVCFFHQNPRRLIDTADEIRTMLTVDKLSVPAKRRMMLLNVELKKDKKN